MNLPRDILLNITSRLDNETLQSISKTHLWNEVSLVISDQNYWFLRVEMLVSLILKRESGDWKKTYYIIQKVLAAPVGLAFISEINLLSIKILLELKYDPTLVNNCSLLAACKQGDIEVVRLLLQDERVLFCEHNRIWEYGHERGWYTAISTASSCGHLKIVELLLQDQEIDPNLGCPLVEAIENNHSSIVRLLLNDQRIDINQHVLYTEIRRIHEDMKKMLLQDPRVNSSLMKQLLN